MTTVTMRKTGALALLLAAGALSACGSDDSGSDSSSKSSTPAATATQSGESSASGGGETLKIAASEKDGLSFDKKTLSAKAGKVTIVMDNPQGNQLPHAVELEGNGVEQAGEVVQAGGTSEATADLKPGKYEFYCPVGDHRSEGMEGTLTVQ